MLRWLIRLAVGALIIALLVWVWSRFNEDLEEEEFEEEIPLEFEVSAGDGADSATHEMRASSDPTVADLSFTAPPDGTTQVDMDAPPGQVAAGDTIGTGNGPATEENAAADALAATESAAENGISERTLGNAPALTATVTATGGEEDDTTVPPREGPRSQGTQEGYNPTEREAELEAPPPGAGDNMELIRGIGPKYAAQLAEMSITTFGALINTPVDELVVSFPRVTEEELRSWIDQARELVESNP